MNLTLKRRVCSPSAFSLVEVVIAFGILAFTGVSMVGMLSVAFSSLKASSFDSLATRIASEVRSDLQQIELNGSSIGVRHYDAEGHEVSANDRRAVYDAYRSEIAHQLPGTSASTSNHLRCITVQVLQNPGQTGLTVDSNGWVAVPQTIASKTFSFYVFR